LLSITTFDFIDTSIRNEHLQGYARA